MPASIGEFLARAVSSCYLLCHTIALTASGLEYEHRCMALFGLFAISEMIIPDFTAFSEVQNDHGTFFFSSSLC